jgi:hypothetical protein
MLRPPSIRAYRHSVTDERSWLALELALSIATIVGCPVAGLAAPARPDKNADVDARDDEERSPEPAVALVRLVSSQNVPDGWLELEGRLSATLEARALEVRPAARAAESLRAGGNRFDRAVDHLEQGLVAAERALARRALKEAQRELKDADDLLDLGGVVAIVPANLLVRYHRIRALTLNAAKNPEARRAAADLVGLEGVRLEEDKALDDLDLPAREASGQGAITIEASPANAVILIDGRALGTGTLRRYDLPATRHYLRVIAPGREAFGERLNLKASDLTRREIRLPPLVESLASVAEEVGADSVPKRRVDELKALAGKLDAGTLVFLSPADSRGLKVRCFEPGGRGFLPVVSIPFDAAGEPLARLVDVALGRAPPTSRQILATQVATGLTASALTPPSPEAPAPGTARDADATTGSFDARWPYAAGGAVLVIGGIIAAVLVSRSSSGPGKATVWLCPGREACAP